MRNFQSFLSSLVPIILLTKTDEASGDMEMIDASQYLSDYAQITLESTTDGESQFYHQSLIKD